MKRLFLLVALAVALPILADDRKPPPDTRENVGTDQVNVFYCPAEKKFWTRGADVAPECPYCKSTKCSKAAGDYKVVVKAKQGTLKAGAEGDFDIEVFQIVVDKDSKPDEVRVTDLSSVKAKFRHFAVKAGEDDEDSKVMDARIGGEKKIASVSQALKKGDWRIIIEAVRGDKEKTKIECEVDFHID